MRPAGSSVTRWCRAVSPAGRRDEMRQLSGVDALHVLEETPDQHMHTIKMVLLAPRPDDAGPRGVPSYDEVRSWAQDTLPRLPPLRWMVRKIPLGLARPVFIDAGAFDVGPHITTVHLDA